MKRLLFLLLLISPAAFGQENDIVDDVLEFFLEELEGEFNFDTFMESLGDYQNKPLNLNKASREELEEFGLLSALQIEDFLNYRNEIGELVNQYELQCINTFDLKTIHRILPFVKVGSDLDDFDFRGLFTKGKHEWFGRYTTVLQEQEGYIENDTLENGSVRSAYPGNRAKFYSRYRYKYERNFSMGVTAEKDSGEQFFRGAQNRGFDFYSAHVALNNFKNFKHLVVGDYEVRLGQGLVAWTGLAFSKSSDVMNIKRKANPIKAYTSVNEFAFFRGAAATYELKDFEITLFGSSKKTDSNIEKVANAFDEEADSLEIATSFANSGFHRSDNEINNRRQLRQTNAGTSVKYKGGNWGVGLNAIYTHFDKPVETVDQLFENFFFQGNEQWNIGVEYFKTIRNIHLFGETAISNTGGLASVNGALVSLHPTLDVSLLYRNIEVDYNALFANAFTENSRTNNEQGFYFGWKLQPQRAWTLKGYVDLYTFPWLRFSIDAPSSGRESLVQLNYKPSRSLEIYARFRNETKGRNLSDNETVTDQVVPNSRSNYRLQLRYKLNKSITFKSRIEQVRFSEGDRPTERGVILFQDVQYKPLSSPITLTGRIALFDTDSFNSRVFAYENDVLYSFSIPGFQGRGTRYYLVTKYRINRNLDFWFRYAQTNFRDRDVVGSGNEESQGSLRSDIRVQLRLKF